MKVKYLGETSPLELIHDKVYEALSIEGQWYRIVDETDEDYLYLHCAVSFVAAFAATWFLSKANVKVDVLGKKK